MNRSNNLITFIARSILAAVCLFSNNVFADCDSTAGTHYPTVTGPNYQGSAHTDSFDCAINGTRQLTLEEINERNDLLPPSLNNRFYVRIGANAAAEGLTGVKNILPNNISTGAFGQIQNARNKVASNNFELAFGYVWSEFAFDLEWLSSASVSYETLIYNITPSFTLTSTVKGDAILGNIYWIFKDLYNVKLYLDFIVGNSNNRSVSTIGGGSPNAFKRYHWAFGLGVGGRFNLWSKLYADVSGRYIYLGTARLEAWGPSSTFTYLKVQRTWLGAAVCLLWLI